MFLGEPSNWNHDRVQLLSLYSARRTVPTVADVMGMAPGDRAALGAWADNAPKSTITQIVRRLKMPMRYARDARGLLVKKAVMRHLRVAVPLSGVPNCCWKSLLSRYPALGKRSLFARRVQQGFRTKSGSHSSKRVREPGVWWTHQYSSCGFELASKSRFQKKEEEVSSWECFMVSFLKKGAFGVLCSHFALASSLST